RGRPPARRPPLRPRGLPVARAHTLGAHPRAGGRAAGPGATRGDHGRLLLRRNPLPGERHDARREPLPLPHLPPHDGRAVRHLGAACGTALTFRETARPGSVDVTVGSMDRPDAIVPAAHIWTASQLAWLRLGDDLPRHPGEDPAERDVEP